MSSSVQGLHHLTALSGHPDANIAFYAGVLGLRLLKISVNPDDPSAYQLFYGNETGRPGTVLSFYCYPSLKEGIAGRGSVQSVGLSVPPKALSYWSKRLKKYGIPHSKQKKRFSETYLELKDPDGLHLELVASEKDARPAYSKGSVDPIYGIRGIHHVCLSLIGTGDMLELLEKYLQYKRLEELDTRLRLKATAPSGTYVDLAVCPEALPGELGRGTIHHLAFSIANKSHLISLRKSLLNLGVNISPVLDRTYFYSFFFPAVEGIVIEIATPAPGYTVDEPLSQLGSELKIPPSLEEDKEAIEKALPKITVDLTKLRGKEAV